MRDRRAKHDPLGMLPLVRFARRAQKRIFTAPFARGEGLLLDNGNFSRVISGTHKHGRPRMSLHHRRRFLQTAAAAAGAALFPAPYARARRCAEAQGQDHRREVHDRARHLGLEPGEDRNRCRSLWHRRSLLGSRGQGRHSQHHEAASHRRGSAERRQALHKSADAKRRRRRHCRCYGHGRERH